MSKQEAEFATAVSDDGRSTVRRMFSRRSVGVMVVVLMLVGAFFVARLGWRGGVDGPVVTSPRSFGGGANDALVIGTVLIEDDCVFLLSADGERATPVAFPAGTRWDAQTEEIIVGSERVRSGGVIEGSGGHHSGETLAIVIGDRAHGAIQRCIDSDVAQTTNQLEEIGVTVFNRATFPPTGSSVEVVESR